MNDYEEIGRRVTRMSHKTPYAVEALLDLLESLTHLMRVESIGIDRALDLIRISREQDLINNHGFAHGNKIDRSKGSDEKQ